MKFSVILPIYNVEAYLTECAESILSQTYNDYELILVNDGSKDSSLSICEEYAKKYSSIKVVNQPNAGLSMARNNGLSVAQGDYIIFIDSDDFILSNEFLQQVAKRTESGTDLIFYKHRRFLDESKTLCECSYSYKNAIPAPDPASKIRQMVTDDAFYGSAWIKAIKRSVLTDNKILFEKGLLGEDMEWNYHLMMHTQSIELIDEAYLAYRQREGSISQSLKLKNLTDFVYILQKWSEPVNSLKDSDLRLALLGSLAKYYSNLLVVYSRVQDNDKLEYKKQIKELSWVLKYGLSKRPNLVYKVYRLFGFNITILLLKLLDRIK